MKKPKLNGKKKLLHWTVTMPEKVIPLVMVDYEDYTTKVYDVELQKSIDDFKKWQDEQK